MTQTKKPMFKLTPQHGGYQQPRLRPGEIVTSIKMNVGQNSSPKNDARRKNDVRVPPPVDVSNVTPVRTIPDAPNQQKTPALSSEIINSQNSGKFSFK
jgi:hypothetical protein